MLNYLKHQSLVSPATLIRTHHEMEIQQAGRHWNDAQTHFQSSRKRRFNHIQPTDMDQNLQPEK